MAENGRSVISSAKSLGDQGANRCDRGASSPNELRAPRRRFSSIERNRAKNLNSAEHAFNLAAEAATTSNAGSSGAGGKIMERSGGTALLVLGMHRSGTSSMAGAMVRLGGAALNLLPASGTTIREAFGNPSVLMTLNNQILAAGGSHWEDWRQFDPSRIDAAAAFALEGQARSALAGEFGDASLAVIKDPRMCRLMPFWSSVFRQANWSVRPVLQLRSPLEVALSLNRRDGIPLGLGCLIWLRHVLDAEAGTRGMGRAIVDWNDFLGDPRLTLGRRGRAAWRRLATLVDGVLAEIDEFVSADMRPNEPAMATCRSHPAVNYLVREAYAAVRELVDSPASEKVGRTLADIRERFDGAAAIFGCAMGEMEKESRRAQSATVAGAQRIDDPAHRGPGGIRAPDQRGVEPARKRMNRVCEPARRRCEGNFAVRLRRDAERISASRGDEANPAMSRVPKTSSLMSVTGTSVEAPPKSRFRDYFRPRQKRKEGTDSRPQFGVFRPGILSGFEPGRPRFRDGRGVPLPVLWRRRRPGSRPLFLHRRIFGQISRRRRIRRERACPLRDVRPP